MRLPVGKEEKGQNQKEIRAEKEITSPTTRGDSEEPSVILSEAMRSTSQSTDGSGHRIRLTSCDSQPACPAPACHRYSIGN
jgi:hypothetical protein